MDMPPEGHPQPKQQSQQYANLPAHVAIAETELEDARQRAYQAGLDDAADFVEEALQPAFYADPSPYSRPPFNQWQRGRMGYPRGPGRRPRWAPFTNQYTGYRPGLQNQRPEYAPHPTQRPEFTATSSEGQPPPAKVMCPSWDGHKCHSSDPTCGLGHPPGVCAQGGGKSST